MAKHLLGRLHEASLSFFGIFLLLISTTSGRIRLDENPCKLFSGAGLVNSN